MVFQSYNYIHIYIYPHFKKNKTRIFHGLVIVLLHGFPVKKTWLSATDAALRLPVS